MNKYQLEKKENTIDWQERLVRLQVIAAEIRNRRGEKQLIPTPEEVIRQMRRERDEQLQNHLA